MRAGVRVRARTDSLMQAPANLALALPSRRRSGGSTHRSRRRSFRDRDSHARNNRFVGYVAVEALAWWMYAKDISERSARENQFKELRTRSRARLTSPRHCPTRTGRTTSGCVTSWRAACTARQRAVRSSPRPTRRRTTGSDGRRCRASIRPRAEALARYEQVAIKPEFRWSWRNAQIQYDIYKRDTDKRNDANRAAVHDLMLIGANHVLSMVDAFATLRLQVQPEADGRHARSARACAGEPNHRMAKACNCCSYRKLTSFTRRPYYGASPLTSLTA